MRNRLTCVAALTVLAALAGIAAADTTDIFVAVDEVAVAIEPTAVSSVPRLELTGVLDGGAAPVTQVYTGGNATAAIEVAQRCERLALLAMARPGRYALEVVRSDTPSSGRYFVHACRLARVD